MPIRPLLGGYSLTFTSGYLWLIALLFLASVAFTIFYYRRTNPPLEFGRRLLLGILRGIAVTALCFILAEPLLLISKTKVEPPAVALLVDNSTSVAENRNSHDQFAAIDQVMADIESRIGAGIRVVKYSLSDTITADGVIDGSAHATAIGNGLEYLANDLEGQNLQSVVLVSDGVSNYGNNPATVAKSLNVPVNSIGLGSPDQLPDVRIVDVIHNPVGFADKEYEIEVVLETRGFENLQVPVRVRHHGANLTQKNATLLGQGRQQSLDLTMMPPGEGSYTLEISIPAQEQEQTGKNNSKQIQVKFRKSRIKILLAAAYLNWDFKFIKRALVSKSDFDVATCIESPRRIEGTTPFPDNLAALSDYDALILYDFDSEWLTARRQLFDAFFDRTGTGVFIVAAENYASNEETDYTLQLFPHRVLSARPVVIRGEAPLLPTQEGRIHPILQLSEDPSLNAGLLAALPPLEGTLKTDGIADNAVVLATTPSVSINQPEQPLLSVHRYRTGKVALLTAFPLWKLDFLTRSFSKSDSSFVKIMENVVLWLVARDDLERVSISPERPIFVAGESINLNARVLDESYLPVGDAEIEATLVSDENPADTMVIGFQAGRPGSYSATLHYLAPGTYQVRGQVLREDVTLGTPTTTFVVEPYSLEDLSQVADFDMLKRVAEVSGGTFVALGDTIALPEIADLPELEITRTAELALFDYPAMLLLFILSVCVEWYLRRRYQLL